MIIPLLIKMAGLSSVWLRSMERGFLHGIRCLLKSRGVRIIPQRFYCEGKPISRFPVPEISSLASDIRERIEEVEEKSGFIPNVFKTLAHRPAEFRAFFDYYDALMLKENNLTKAEKEMIVVATSAANNCMYCVVAHGALLRIYSKNSLLGDQVAINWKSADLSDRERAILEFATKVGRSESIGEQDFKALEDNGLGTEDAWDIGAIAAFFAMSNRLAHMTDMRPNDDFYLLGRLPKNKK